MSPRDKVLSVGEIKSLIADGRAIVIYKNYVLDISKWLPKHPGGDKVIHHMIGIDATDEMEAYHSEETAKSFKVWKIGIIDYEWQNLLPPIRGGKYLSNQDLDSFSDSSDFTVISSKEGFASQDEFTSSVPSSHEFTDDMEKTYKGMGYPKGKITSKVPQEVKVVDKNNYEEIYPIHTDAIVDPKLLMQNFDNSLTRDDYLNVPALDYETQNKLRQEYKKLHDLLIEGGFYQCNYWNYVRELVKIGSLFLFSFSFFKLNYLKISALLMGMAWQQMTFVVHDAGHVSITHNYEFDNLFGMIIADWFGGLSIGWWKRNHNVHHLITNDPVHDPDIQHLPFFAVSVRLFESVYSTYYEKYLPFDAFCEKFLKFQQYLYYPILCFGRFNLYRLSWAHLLGGMGPRKGKAAWFRYFEITGLVFFFYWYFYLLIYKSIDSNWDRFMFVMISHVATMLVHVQITLSHFAMSTSDLGTSESFVSRQLRTTMDVDCPLWLDFLHGGLQFQAIHHLFPRLPRHNLRKAQPYVIDFCNSVGLKYYIYGFGQGNEIVIGKLAEISKQCQIMVDATKKLKDH